MIKTVSFAPPRAASRSNAKNPASPRVEKKAASGSPSPKIPAQPALDFTPPEPAITPTHKPKAEVKTEVKTRKPRVPKDLAIQYGEKSKRVEVAAPIEVETPKKRLSRAERDARRELIKPSESLLERLARVNQVTLSKPKAQPRGKGWKFVCGRCGQTSYFETEGALCICGAIAIKE